MMNINDLFDSPDYFPLALEGAHAVFAEMDRDAYNRSIFCDMRISAKSKQMTKIALAPLCDYEERQKNAAPAVSFIFHMAHCGSTLLARALDIPDENIVYREPLALRQLAVEKSSAGFSREQDWRRRLKLVTRLLARRYAKEGPAIVKANVPVNFIIPDILNACADEPSIMLYFPLEHYLMAILRSPNHRKWVASVVTEMQRGIAKKAPLENNMSIAKAAAALWLSQILIYQDAASAHPKVASLNAEDLFETPDIAVRRSFEHFGQSVTEEKIGEIVGGELFARYSKNPQVAFDNAARLARREALRQELKPELAEARAWVAARAGETRLPARLANPLIGEGADLLAPA